MCVAMIIDANPYSDARSREETSRVANSPNAARFRRVLQNNRASHV
jgi:hypothetical protein